MRKRCRNLTYQSTPTGHWMAQERPRNVNASPARWLATQVPQAWPRPRTE